MAKLGKDKAELYSFLVYHSQFLLLPIEICTMPFLADILKKKKHVFQMFEIIPFMVQEKYRRILTIDRVLGMLKSNHFAENYM